MATTAKPPNVTAAEIKKYLLIEKRRKALNRQANDLSKTADEIERKMIALVRSSGGRSRTVIRGGYRLLLQKRPGSVGWKEEFIRVAGMDRAEKLIAAAPPRDHLSVEKQ